MSQWGYPYTFPYFTGADDDAAAAATDPAAADGGAAAVAPAVTPAVAPAVAPVVTPIVDTTATDAAAAAAAAQAQALAAQQALLAQQASLAEVAPLPIVRRHHIWRSLLTGRTFRTMLGTPRDHQMARLALSGRVIRVAGQTTVGAAGDLYFQVVRPEGATLRWQDSTLMEGHSALPYGAIFQGTLRPHDLVEVSLPGYVGWISVYDLNQLGATPTGAHVSGAQTPPSDPHPTEVPPPMPNQPCPPDMIWDHATYQCMPVHPYATGVDPYGAPMTPACPLGTTFNGYACVPVVPAPPQPPVSTLAHAAGWEGEWPHHHHHHHREWWEREPMPIFTGAEAPQHHAQQAQHHAQQQQGHEHAAQNHPDPSARAHHGEQAQRHGAHAEHHAREAQRGHGGAHGRGDFHHPAHGHGRGGFAPRGHGGFSRHYHAHPEWHGHGHPAWQHGVNDRWQHHHAECASSDTGAGVGAGIGLAMLGPLGALFGGLAGKKAACLVEKISSPDGYTSYRVTPSGEQQGAQLDLAQIDANSQFTQTTGQPPLDANAGPLPGSDVDAANGSQPPPADDKGSAGDQASPPADQPPPPPADPSAPAVQGYFAGAPCGPSEYWDDQHQACVPVSFPTPPTGPAPQCPPGQFFDYLRQACVPAATHAAGYHHFHPHAFYEDPYAVYAPPPYPYGGF